MLCFMGFHMWRYSPSGAFVATGDKIRICTHCNKHEFYCPEGWIYLPVPNDWVEVNTYFDLSY